jgi:hypothetical protein
MGLDCAVMETLHQLRREEKNQPYDTVRGFFGRAMNYTLTPDSASWTTFKSAFGRPSR